MSENAPAIVMFSVNPKPVPPAGAVVRQELQTFIGEELRKQGYHQVFTPHIGKLTLYKTSGHFPYYKDSQFTAFAEPDDLARLAGEGCSCAN